MPRLSATARTCHQAYRADLKPALQVAQGERFTLEARSILGSDRHTLPSSYAELVIPVTGPVQVDGVQPGDTIRVDVVDIEVADTGAMVTLPGYGLFGDRIAYCGRIVPIVDGVVEFAPGVHLPVEPMVGKLGVAVPGDPPRSSTVGHFGGNMDNKHLAAGSSLFLRSNVAGALLYGGDLHACQADGESSMTAVEVAGTLTLEVRVVPALPVSVPVVQTPEHVMTIGDGPDLDAAVKDAADAMAVLLQRSRGWPLETAAMAMSLIADVGVCQLVNPRLSGKITVPSRFLRDMSDWREHDG